jgi:hypothetical protein
MKKLEDFECKKVELKNINGGRMVIDPRYDCHTINGRGGVKEDCDDGGEMPS